MIGGKACGMLLARKIIENCCPDTFSCLEPHDSFYIGCDVFYSYIVHNHFWEMRVKQKQEENYFSLAPEMKKLLQSGSFPTDLEEQFLRLLDYYGQDPFIVRSSSILEDGFGNAFAGKYESVFCSNSGTREENLKELKTRSVLSTPVP
jgi:phosphoenolpyruvate synthase/pyruvate phosphate dikinase